MLYYGVAYQLNMFPMDPAHSEWLFKLKFVIYVNFVLFFYRFVKFIVVCCEINFY